MDEKVTESTRVPNETQSLISVKVQTLATFSFSLEKIFNSAEQVPLPLATVYKTNTL